jgi:hypothetical protein
MVDWVIVVVVIVIVALFIILFAWFRRRRDLTVTVQNAQTLLPISGATVSASGPQDLSGTTAGKGEIVFTSVKAGDYSVKASAPGYNTSMPTSVSVKNNTEYVVKLEPIAPVAKETKTK